MVAQWAANWARWMVGMWVEYLVVHWVDKMAAPKVAN